MARYLVIRYLSPVPGEPVAWAEVAGLTNDTQATPAQIADQYRQKFPTDQPCRVFVLNVAGGAAFDQAPSGPPTPAPVNSVAVPVADAIATFKVLQ